HTVGPVWRGGDAGEHETLANCYRSTLKIARERGFRTVAFPAIATGVYGFPRDAAARIAVAEVRRHLAEHHVPQQIIFVCFDAPTLAAYRAALDCTAG